MGWFVLSQQTCCHASLRKRWLLTDRVRFITHQRKQILLVDLSNCSASQVQEIIRTLPELVTTQPRGSVLILSDFAGASFDEEAVRVMKEAAVFDKPFIKKTAWVGAEDFPEKFAQSVKTFSRRTLPLSKPERTL
jgi:hypothetical protein